MGRQTVAIHRSTGPVAVPESEIRDGAGGNLSGRRNIRELIRFVLVNDTKRASFFRLLAVVSESELHMMHTANCKATMLVSRTKGLSRPCAVWCEALFVMAIQNSKTQNNHVSCPTQPLLMDHEDQAGERTSQNMIELMAMGIYDHDDDYMYYRRSRNSLNAAQKDSMLHHLDNNRGFLERRNRHAAKKRVRGRVEQALYSSNRQLHFGLGFISMGLINILMMLLVPASNPEYTEERFLVVFPVFRFFLMMNVMVWLLSWVLLWFERYGINYVFLLEIDPDCPG